MAVENPFKRLVSKRGLEVARHCLKLIFSLAVYFGIGPLAAIANLALLVVYSLRHKTYRDTTYTPIAVDDLPPATRRYFEKHSAEFEQCGFVAAGDFFVEHWRGYSRNRGFRHGELPILAEITDNGVPWIGKCYCMYSVVENGTLIETTRRWGIGVPQIDYLHFVFAKGKSPRGLLEQHLAALRGYEESGLGILPLVCFDFDELHSYGMRLLYLHSSGARLGPLDRVSATFPASASQACLPEM